MEEKTIISTGSELFRELKKRSLELRKENGRDDSIYSKLCERMGCEKQKLQEYLDSSNITAGEFLTEFLKVTEPFVLMYKEIWEYMRRYSATNANENIKIKIGPETDLKELNLNDFTKQMYQINEVYKIERIIYWSQEALWSLFGLFDIFRNKSRNEMRELIRIEDYSLGDSLELPSIISKEHEFDKIILLIKDALQKIIDDYYVEYNGNPEENSIALWLKEKDDSSDLKNLALQLTDIIPGYYRLCNDYYSANDSIKNQAILYYKNEIEPKIKVVHMESDILKLINVLELPFWKYRWHTYEIWATVITLNCLENYKLSPCIVDGFIPFETTKAQILAKFETVQFKNANIALQVQTPYIRESRKAIKPDLRICYDYDFIPDNTAIVVEYKQRKKMDNGKYIKMATAYRDGESKCKGVITLNYDNYYPKIGQPDFCYYLSNITPINRQNISNYKKLLTELMKKSNLEPLQYESLILLDISGSMKEAYQDDKVKMILSELNTKMNILRFNDGLVDAVDKRQTGTINLDTYGGTMLSKALLEIKEKIGLPSKVLVVTDGEHDNSTSLINEIGSYKECMPKDINKYIDWLTGK